MEKTLRITENADAHHTHEIGCDVIQCYKRFDPKFQKREYHRERQREYRKIQELEVLFLKQRVFELENKLQNMVQYKRIENVKKRKRSQIPSLLPWKDVAISLKEDNQHTWEENENLKKQILQLQQVARNMTAWFYSRNSIGVCKATASYSKHFSIIISPLLFNP